ncbi:MAG TPA: trigger factor [Acidimicrobiales bacterium]
MKAVAEPIEGNKVKLTVEVDDDVFDAAIGDAVRAIAREVRIPGFRPGKAPRKVIEKRLGTELVREQAIREALPEIFAKAAMETETDAIAPPDIDITSGRQDGPLRFTATVETRPIIEISGYHELRVEVPSPVLSDEEIDAQVDRLRRQIGSTLRPADRPAIDGDQVTIDISGTHDGEPVPGLTADDYGYQVGSGAVVPELDQQLHGSKPGDILEFTAAVPGSEEDGGISLRVLVKEVQELVLPALTDEWASDASEFDTVEELKADMAERLGGIKRVTAIMSLRQSVVDAIAELCGIDPPEPMVSNEMADRLHQLQHRLDAQGATLEQYFASTGQSPEQIQQELRATAESACKADLALRALIVAEDLGVTDDELAEEIRTSAERGGIDPDELRARLEHDDRLPEVRSDLSKGKAVEWLIEHVTVVDPEGNEVDRDLLEPPEGLDDGGLDDAPAIEAESHDHRPHGSHDHEHGDDE